MAGYSAKTGHRPSWAVQPATASARNGRDRRIGSSVLLAAANANHDNGTNPFLESLRAIGLIRQRGRRPVVGRKAYVRWWERLRAMVALGAIVIALGIALAAVVGIVILGAGFLLEQAIA